MSIAVDAFAAELIGAVRSEKWRNGELLVTPWTFRDNEPIVLYVSERASGTYVVTDRGQSADNLSLAGVDLSRRDVARSWEAVQRSIDRFPFVADTTKEWELAATSATEELGMAIHQVAEAALRADGLRALSRTQPTTKLFDDWVIRTASEKGLTVIPHAEVKSTIGVTRKVSAHIRGHLDAYVQAVGKTKKPWEAYDRARSVFMDSSLSSTERFTVIANGSKLTSEQILGIGQHSEVVLQDDFPKLLETVA